MWGIELKQIQILNTRFRRINIDIYIYIYIYIYLVMEYVLVMRNWFVWWTLNVLR
ncbi:MAG: hypothetical protein N7Q72_01560 [Spiroplasma sp. Tabriz.8]|nr:hypothetical protein [Spiroplasma sp. Tabriz.8]